MLLHYNIKPISCNYFIQVHEDCNLNNDCDQNGLIVCKYNKFMMTKRCLSPWLPQVFEWSEDSIMRTDIDIPKSEMSGDKILKWIRQVAPPSRISFVVINELGQQTVDPRNIKSSFLTKLTKTNYGKAHIVAFVDGAESSNDIEEYSDSNELRYP
jgi:hypothetical protein